jgi:hypothetical protein
MCEIQRTDIIAEWIKSPDEDARESILKYLIILKEIGPNPNAKQFFLSVEISVAKRDFMKKWYRLLIIYMKNI